jgi:hypothetical protein
MYMTYLVFGLMMVSAEPFGLTMRNLEWSWVVRILVSTYYI